MSTTVQLRFPGSPPVPPSSNIEKARKFAETKGTLDSVRAKILEIGQALVELDNVQGVDFNPNPNEVTVVGRNINVAPPVLNGKAYKNMSNVVAAELRYTPDGELLFAHIDQRDPSGANPDNPRGHCTYRYERHTVKAGIPFINRRTETVQDYSFSGAEVYKGQKYVNYRYEDVTEHTSSGASLRFNESTGKLKERWR
jgi:hypothetical protein